MASLPESRARGDVLQVVKNLGPDVLVLREGGGAGAPQPRAGEVVVFTSFLVAGLAPLFSEFLKYVLSYYGIHLAHLVPNSIVILSTFAHFCQMFLGIPPNLHLFRYFFLLRPHGSDGIVGSCSFQRRGDIGLDAFIPLTLKDKWIGWTQHWSYVTADSSWESLQWPEAGATWKPEWGAKEVLKDRAQGALDRIRHLREAGLTGTMVIGDFVRRRLSPLRERAHMACCYRGVDDETRTHIGGTDHPSVGAFSLSIFSSFFFFLTGKSAAAAGWLDGGSLKSWLCVLQPHAMTEDLAAFALPPGVVPLCDDGALFEQVQKAMSSWDTVGPARTAARGPLRIPGTSEVRVLRPRPPSSAGGARGVRGRQSPGPESRAAGKRPRLEASARRPTAAESASTAEACGGG